MRCFTGAAVVLALLLMSSGPGQCDLAMIHMSGVPQSGKKGNTEEDLQALI